ncbi:hypothetical protein MXD62_14620 [Frankia sp. Mgl5]|uniref:hypothetical protein n=1 Tax=Frankiaceae TaxID=74712 RepID=UPI000DA4F970|nr:MULTISPECIES: hypothetical protein [Frankiaceae]MCK9928391.1 hypothetical protein [Frankia sp. Mgl5]TCJ32142.1 hypothetical protein E0504_44525 [Parafrankia sp. BMG5.11]CAI7981116.1 conserved hypothetical protein [Frankia sp. Hr75.2]SQD96087.1 conserved hypothetical protein [Parafrankia sp. Ea1.12]
MIFRRRSDSAGSSANDDPAAVAGGARGPGDDVVRPVRQLQRELAELVAGANANGGRLPPGAVPTVRDIDDVLRPLLRYIEVQSASEEEMRYLTAIVHEYLPQALGDFVALPAHYADRPGVTGTTPADDLIRQLQLLDEGANELQDLVYTGDAAKLAIQARFLDAKFRRSDLDS